MSKIAIVLADNQALLERVKDLFESRPEVVTVYITSDENIFTAEHYAHNWKCSLADKSVLPVTRIDVFGEVKAASTDGVNDDDDQGGGNTANDADKEKADALIKRYIELFDTKPDPALTQADIAAAIASKETEANDGGKKIIPTAPANEGAADEKAALVAEYQALTGKKDGGFKKPEVLKAAIAEAKAKQ